MHPLKRLLSAFLILAQLATPTYAAGFDGLSGLTGILNLVSSVSGTIASIGEAQQTREAEGVYRQNEQNAKQIFAIAPRHVSENAQSTVLGDRVEVFDPNDPAQSQRLQARLQSARAAIAGKRVISTEELRAYTEAILPYMRLVEANARATGAGEVVVPPGAEVNFDMRGFRIDSDAQIATQGTPLRLIPKNTAVPEDAREIYDALMHYAAGHPQSALDVQNLVSHMSRVAAGTVRFQTLERSQAALLNAALPGGAARAQNWLTQNAGKYRTTGTPLATSNPDYGHSLLAPGIAAIAEIPSSGNSQIKVRIKNTTDQPYTFKAQDYVAAPPDGQGRIALAHALNSIDAGDEICASPNKHGVEAAKDLIKEAGKDLAGKQLEAAALPYLKAAIKSPVLQNVLRVSPLLGNGIAAVEAYTGQDAFTGETLTPAERALAVASIAPIEGNIVRAGAMGVKGVRGLKRGNSGAATMEKATGSSKIVPGGGLAAHEYAGGHLIDKHVGLAESDLSTRLATDSRISAASTFTNRATAEAAVSTVLDSNTVAIQSFLKSSDRVLVLNGSLSGPVGINLSRGFTNAVSVSNVRVVLQRDTSMSTGYRIVTGFPIP